MTGASDVGHAGRFELRQRLGEAATAVVWRAWDRQAGEERALKIYASSVSRDSVESEYRILSALACEAVPRAFEVADVDGKPALVMEYLPGKPLSVVLREMGGPLAGGSLESLTMNLLAAVEALHPSRERQQALSQDPELSEYFRLAESGHLHRDFTSDNVVVLDEHAWTVKLVDVQLARDVTLDLYALGVIFHELLLGARPGKEDALVRVREFHGSDDFRACLLKFFSRALAPLAAERFSSVVEMRRAWEEVLAAPR